MNTKLLSAALLASVLAMGTAQAGMGPGGGNSHSLGDQDRASQRSDDIGDRLGQMWNDLVDLVGKLGTPESRAAERAREIALQKYMQGKISGKRLREVYEATADASGRGTARDIREQQDPREVYGR